MSEWLAMQERLDRSIDHPYKWVITRDRSAEFDDNPGEPGTNMNAVGIEGPITAPNEEPEAYGIKPVLFRLMDEGDIDDCNEGHPNAVGPDHELYGVVYEGKLYDPEGMWAFGPLDDYGRPNYGCTGIKLYDDDKGVWEWV